MLVDWYLYGFDTQDQGGDFQSDNVIYYNNNVQVELTSISHLALNECGGNVTVAPLIITPIFTNSEYFSYSQFFSKSSHFSNSEPFSKTLDFSNSGEFTKTGEFSKTSSFSETTKFSESFVLRVSKIQ